MRRNQNVSAPVAVIVIVATVVVFFLVFNRPGQEATPPSKPVPEPPPVDEREVGDMYKGLSPLGLAAVVPPLPEDRMQGVRVAMVGQDRPAQRAGIRPGDLIVSFDGKNLVAQQELVYLLNQVKPTKTYPIVVTRSGQRVKLSVTGLTPLPPEEQVGF